MRGPVGENGHAPQSSSANGATEDATTELSRLMLEGWTMMAETCPRNDCYVPLARSREGQLYCCGCRSNIAPPDNGDGESASNAALEEPSEDPPTDETDTPPDTDDGANSVVAIRGGAATGSELSVSNAFDAFISHLTLNARVGVTDSHRQFHRFNANRHTVIVIARGASRMRIP